VHSDGVPEPINASPASLPEVIHPGLLAIDRPEVDGVSWEAGRCSPTPTIVEAATAHSRDHAVQEVSRRDAGAINLRRTSAFQAGVIERARRDSEKVICFFTGVPGSGKALVGLDIATRFMDRKSERRGVFLSGNGPLVAVLRDDS
jgi:hypothetical protein